LATRTQKTKEHAFKRIQKDLKEGLGNPLFFYGEEQYLVRWAADLIVEHYVEPNLRQLNCSRLERERATVEAIIEQCETLPMLSEKRVVIVEDFPAGGESIKESYTEAEENEDFPIYWYDCNQENPVELERMLIEDFIVEYGVKPFANLR
jgi:DNA polymerase-3 subunit delta